MKIGNVILSRISALHYVKLVGRSALFLLVLGCYIYDRLPSTETAFVDGFLRRPLILLTIWLVFAFEMFLRFFPDQVESMGCQKQFSCNYRAAVEPRPRPSDGGATLAAAASWLALNGTIGALYFLHVIDRSILILVSLAYSVCDMVCILFFCPFQTWFLKNKCCVTCRIYNWDYAMMFTPLIFIPSWFTWSLLALALLLLAKWEYNHARHGEYFYEETNDTLRCQNCQEHLCSHKKQLISFHRKLRQKLLG
ncbi:MAG: hypothetical protein E7426_00865 [Ruminococcaceae bacterium]|nr:hypothetical protein [Oscillospiraceae bacterium]